MAISNLINRFFARPIPVLIIAKAEPVRSWPFYGNAVSELKNIQGNSVNYPTKEAREKAYIEAIQYRVAIIRGHQRAIDKLEADLSALRKHLPPDVEIADDGTTNCCAGYQS